MNSTKLEQYVAALEISIRALDSAFVRANAAETVTPRQPVSRRWAMAGPDRDEAERAEIASYDVTPDHWGARLSLMSAFESLHAALRVITAGAPAAHLDVDAWQEAAVRSREASRLAGEAQRVFTGSAEL